MYSTDYYVLKAMFYRNRLRFKCYFIRYGCHYTLNTKHSTGCTSGWMFVYMMQPDAQPVVKPVEQPVVSCKRGITELLSYKYCVALCSHNFLNCWVCELGFVSLDPFHCKLT